MQPPGRQAMSAMPPRQPSIARASPTCAASPARKGAFKASAAGGCRLNPRRRWARPGGWSGVLVRLGPDGDRPPRVALLSAHASRELGTGPTVRG
jgi:hypothetical protein